MSDQVVARRKQIQASQNTALYAGVKFATIGSIISAFLVIYTFGKFASTIATAIWFTTFVLIYLLRLFDASLFQKKSAQSYDVMYWRSRFRAGALISAVAWGSAVWVFDPGMQQAYLGLLVLILVAVAGSTLATLPYDRGISNGFQAILFFLVGLRLLTHNSDFSNELSLFAFFTFSFLFTCGREVSRNYLDMLCLRQDLEETNVTMISTTERMAQMGYWQWDMVSDTITLSDNLAKMWDHSESRIKLDHCYEIVAQEDKARILQAVEKSTQSDKEYAVEFRVWDRESNEYRIVNQVSRRIEDSHGKRWVLGTIQDITKIRSAEKRIYRMAYYDELTGLANRHHFQEFLPERIEMAQSARQKLAIVYIDLDDFKDINDTYGHAYGDQYLEHFSNYLQSIVRESDLIARLGGDEFCFVLNDIKDNDAVEKFTLLCLEYGQQVVEIGNHRIHPKLSIGISMFPENGETADLLLRNADLAMYSIKQNGKYGYAFYVPQMAEETVNRIELEADLRQAIDRNEFELWYQPKIAQQPHLMHGVEALIRWRHPERGIVPPDLFISTAERVGMIKEIGEWVVTTACQQYRDWLESGLRIPIAVNISGSHFVAPDFPDFVGMNIEKYQIHPGDLEIEITESMTRDPEVHSRVCHVLRGIGAQVAIDDFGTGYSSLSVLGRIEVDTLKIDRSFIQGLPTDETSTLMVETMVNLSLGLGYALVAEGVETREQYEFLTNLGCPYIQGYYFSKPLEAVFVPDFIENLTKGEKAA